MTTCIISVICVFALSCTFYNGMAWQSWERAQIFMWMVFYREFCSWSHCVISRKIESPISKHKREKRQWEKPSRKTVNSSNVIHLELTSGFHETSTKVSSKRNSWLPSLVLCPHATPTPPTECFHSAGGGVVFARRGVVGWSLWYEVLLWVDAVVLHVVVARVHLNVVHIGHPLSDWSSMFPVCN